MFFFFSFLLFGSFSKANIDFTNENLSKSDFQAAAFEKSRNSISQDIIEEVIFDDEDCDNINDTYINVDVTISGCQSINKGITFISNQQEGNTVKIYNSIFIFNSTHSERAMLTFQGILLEINNVTIKMLTDGQIFSSPIFDCSYLYGSSSPSINSLTFVDCNVDSNISIFKFSNYPGILFENLNFEGKSTQCKSVLDCDDNSSVQFTNCNFSNFNEHSTIFALNFIKSELYFTGCNFFKNKCSLFYLFESSPKHVTFDSCHFSENNATDILSFIFLIGNQMTGTIEYSIFKDCYFSHNYIYSSEGGENCYGTVIGLSNSLHFEGTNKFTNCHSISFDQFDPSTTKNYGGAVTIIHTSENPYKLENCSFKNCSANNMGGGLFSCILSDEMTDDDTIVLHLTNCNFTSCTSLENGGGLSCGHSFFEIAYSSQTELKVKSSIFKECRSPVGGGIFFKDQSELGFEQSVLSQTTFDNCQGKNGTAFYIRSDYFTVSNSKILNHYSDSIDEYNTNLLYLNTAHLKTSIQFKEVVFRNNSGQSIEIYSPSTMQMATMNTFENCQFIDNNRFVENHTLINCEKVQASITGFINCSFINNKGRCIYSEMIKCVFLSIGYTSFIGNYGSNGACVCVYSDSVDQVELSLENNAWINNTINSDPTSKIHGGVLSIRNVEIETAGINEFKNNRILSRNNNEKELYLSGSALFAEFTQTKSISFSQFSFENCFALKSGGAVFISSTIENDNHQIVFSNCSFTSNSNKENGGAILIDTKGSTKVTITNSLFANNNANKGGSIYIKEEKKSASISIVLSNSQFFNDDADESGGSIYVMAKNEVTIQSNNFTQTNAKIHGMVISIDLFSKFVLKNNNLYIDKTIDGPSALYVFSSSDAERNFEGSLEIDGGCFTCGRKSDGENSVDFLIYNVSKESNLTISSETCFQESKEKSILVIGDGTLVSVDDSVFNCDKCDDIIPIESDSYSYSEFEPTSSTQTLEPTSLTQTFEPTSSTPVPDPTSVPDDGSDDHKKLGAGTIIGIVLCSFTAVCLIILIAYYIIKRRRSKYEDDLLHTIDYK